ncbi:hypothetical protein A6A08_14660 [Nocardiopsis sp. TSRI0078]|uniref:DUF6504 family protein n=1 Tax=unclassified Nocardiopsis TaxID=2649073 RepID=UPI000940082C|nr:DUF6504 family protein [Nocardiopsis sp. TSRI0078]OKI13527.1 hypothetical protein A6A08_14660 [Nocardiopsis sp. TSRI0078]
MSLLNEQIDVRSTEGGSPVRFTWRGRTFRVRRIIGDWPAPPEASGAPAARVHMLRVSAESDAGEPSIVDISRDAGSDRWTMRRQWN